VYKEVPQSRHPWKSLHRDAPLRGASYFQG